MKASKNKRSRQRTRQPKPMPGDDDNDDLDTLPLGILRKAMGVVDAWRNCHRRACKRGRACRGRQVQCASERPARQQRGDAEKQQRDGARSMAIFQRMLHERMALLDEHAVSEQRDGASPSHARKQAQRKQK